MEHDGFQWWLDVLGQKLEHYDVLRLDHFRGFCACWAVPFGEETAINGTWLETPGCRLFTEAQSRLGDLNIIAEDLGIITDDVVALMDHFAFPGMKVMQFAFDGSPENAYLPSNYQHHCVAYTGTHDNDTSPGWYESASETEQQCIREYLQLNPQVSGKDVAAAMISAAMHSAADLVILPLQDVLGLGSEARFNTPGVAGSNWIWRAGELGSPSEQKTLRDLTEGSGRG